jgi:hypothetical protein
MAVDQIYRRIRSLMHSTMMRLPGRKFK